jgi:hypothetical protein
LNAFGDVGGLSEFIRMFLTVVVGGFSTITENSLITKYLYKYNRDDKRKVVIPDYLEAKWAFNRIFCCCKIQEFDKYQHHLGQVEKDVDMNLDLI